MTKSQPSSLRHLTRSMYIVSALFVHGKTGAMYMSRYTEIFYAYNGPGPYPCYLCKEDVFTPWDRKHDPKNRVDELTIHHIDNDHHNNSPENLTAMHGGCHMRLHRERRPLVAKGSTLPDQWKQRVGDGVRRRYAELEPEARLRWRKNQSEARHNEDKTSTMCECGAGPFAGEHNLAVHRSLSHKPRSINNGSLMCSCGAGPFKGPHGLRCHQGRSKCQTVDLVHEEAS